MLNRVLKSVKEWMDFKHLKLNENKTEFMLVGKKENLGNLGVTNLTINGIQIQIADKVRDLGMIIDSNLNLNPQINNVVRITGYHLRNIAFIKKYIDDDSMKKLVINCIISRVDYCNSIYYGLPKYQLKKLQKILNRAARIVKGVAPRDRVTPTLMELHWLPIRARIEYKICVLAHQAITTGSPPYLRSLLTIMQPSGGVITRNIENGVTLSIPRHMSNIGSRAFRYAAPRLYYNLPIELRKINKIDNFKKKT